MNRLILLVESRIRGNVYVRFGGEHPKTHRSNTAGRWMLSLHICHIMRDRSHDRCFIDLILHPAKIHFRLPGLFLC